MSKLQITRGQQVLPNLTTSVARKMLAKKQRLRGLPLTFDKFAMEQEIILPATVENKLIVGKYPIEVK